MFFSVKIVQKIASQKIQLIIKLYMLFYNFIINLQNIFALSTKLKSR